MWKIPTLNCRWMKAKQQLGRCHDPKLNSSSPVPALERRYDLSRFSPEGFRLSWDEAEAVGLVSGRVEVLAFYHSLKFT
jgi:hypothetical protein